MKTIMTVTITLLCVFTLFFACTYSKKKSSEPPKTSKTFLGDIDFATGDYALYVRHKELGDFVVDDESVLKANRDSIKITRSFLNWLPGATSRTYGVRLFRDRVQVKEKTGVDFSQFEIGDIAQHGKAVIATEEFRGIRAAMEEKLKFLSAQKNVYISRVPKLDKDQRDFHFRVTLPSFAIPIRKEGTHTVHMFQEGENATTWENLIRQRVLKRIKEHGVVPQDFSLNVSHGYSGNVYLKDSSAPVRPDGTRKTLRHAETNRPLMLESHIIYNFAFTFYAPKSVIFQLKKIDFSGLVTQNECQIPQLTESIKQTVLQSNKSELAGRSHFILSTEFYGETEVGEIGEHKYSVEWLEVVTEDS